MAQLDRLKLNSDGLRKVLASEIVRAELVRRAELVAETARADYAARPPHSGEVEVFVDSQGGDARHPRARAAVIAKHPAVLAIEHDRRVLGVALDAGKG